MRFTHTFHRLSCGLLAAFFVMGCHQALPAFSEAPLVIETESQTHRFAVELAIDPQKQARGLMYRREMDENAGMLFIFNPPERAAFWMRNTYIPLDMIFIRALTSDEAQGGDEAQGDDEAQGGDKKQGGGVIEKITTRHDTQNDKVTHSQGEIIAVLELNADTAKRRGIRIGDSVRHPSLDSPPSRGLNFAPRRE